MAAKKSSSKSIFLVSILLVGGVALASCVLCSGGLGYFFYFRDIPPVVGPVLLNLGPEISKEKYENLDFYLTRKEAEEVLGGAGETYDRTKTLEFLKQKNVDTSKISPLIGSTFAIYRTDKRYLIVGFINSKKYGELSSYKGFLTETDGKTSYASTTMSSTSVDPPRDRREVMKKTIADPKWNKQQAKTLILGKWELHQSGFEFKADGVLVQFMRSDPIGYAPGTYRFVDGEHVEMTYPISRGANPAMQSSVRRVLVNEKELVLIEKGKDGKYSPIIQTHVRVAK